MTPDERTLLSTFMRDLTNVGRVAKDADADAMIRQTLATNPDAAYLLVQHAIVADQSLHAAQARIAQLEDQLRLPAAAPSSAGFLPQSSGPWGAQAAPQYAPQQYAPPPVDQRPGIFSGGGGLGSFLRGAGTTAAGVVGGEMLFGGLSDMFGGHHGGGGFGGGGFGGGQGFMGEPQGETIVNNYYGDDSNSGDDQYSDDSGSSDDAS